MVASCSQCLPRVSHLRSTYTHWRLATVPGTGQAIPGHHCTAAPVRCQLISPVVACPWSAPSPLSSQPNIRPRPASNWALEPTISRPWPGIVSPAPLTPRNPVSKPPTPSGSLYRGSLLCTWLLSLGWQAPRAPRAEAVFPLLGLHQVSLRHLTHSIDIHIIEYIVIMGETMHTE